LRSAFEMVAIEKPVISDRVLIVGSEGAGGKGYLIGGQVGQAGDVRCGRARPLDSTGPKASGCGPGSAGPHG
jgi:hypothetical protein